MTYEPLRLLDAALRPHRAKPIAYVVAGHNGSGKTTLWHRKLAPGLSLPLVNADRLTMSILPDTSKEPLPAWARTLRDTNFGWQRVSQRTVQFFIEAILEEKMSFAFETVFSDWFARPDGTVRSKIELIEKLQAADYAVVLIFVGLVSKELSVARVQSRVEDGGHAVPVDKLISRFSNTQRAIRAATRVADVTLMFDNSGALSEAFTVAHFATATETHYDIRDDSKANEATRRLASTWLDIVAPRA